MALDGRSTRFLSSCVVHSRNGPVTPLMSRPAHAAVLPHDGGPARSWSRLSTPFSVGHWQGSTEPPLAAAAASLATLARPAFLTWLAGSALLPPFVLAALLAFLCCLGLSVGSVAAWPACLGRPPTPTVCLCPFAACVCAEPTFPAGLHFWAPTRPSSAGGPPSPLGVSAIVTPAFPFPCVNSLRYTSSPHSEPLSSRDHEHPPQRKTAVGWGAPLWRRCPLWRQGLFPHAHCRIVGRGGRLPRAPCGQ